MPVNLQLPNTELLLYTRTKAVCAVSKFFVFFISANKKKKPELSTNKGLLNEEQRLSLQPVFEIVA